MNKEVLILGGIGIDKRKFHNHKNPILIYDEDIDKIVIFKKVWFLLVKRLISTFLVTKMIIVKLSNCV